MNEIYPKIRHLAVLGGGITGLSAAHRLVEKGGHAVRVTLFERSNRLGGVVSTVHEDGFQIEESADNFITTVPWGLDLCRRLGLAEDLVQTNPAHRRTFVVYRDNLYRLPDGFMMMAPTRMWPLATTPVLSPLGKLRAGCEYFIRRRKDARDESMANFVRRRLGREVFDRLVEPLISAVYAADMEKLSVLATLPRFREMEQTHGSLIRAMRAQMAARRMGESQSGARYSMFVTLRHGLISLVETLASRLAPDDIRLNTSVVRIERQNDRWQLTFDNGTSESFDGLIVATPAPVAGELLDPVDDELGRKLNDLAYEGTAILSVAFRREQIGHPLDGMGFVVPSIEKNPILAGSFSSQKYTHRAPEGMELLRLFVGGARNPDLAERDTNELTSLILSETGKLLRIEGEPVFSRIARWPRTMPQYYVGHLGLVRRIESRVATLSNLELAGNAYHGVGIPNCIHSGEQAAERLLAERETSSMSML